MTPYNVTHSDRFKIGDSVSIDFDGSTIIGLTVTRIRLMANERRTLAAIPDYYRLQAEGPAGKYEAHERHFAPFIPA